MKILEDILAPAFTSLGLPLDIIRVTPSDRPDLADFQSNSAFAGARILGQSPLEVAEAVARAVDDPRVVLSVAGRGFINITLDPEFLVELLLNPEKPQPKNELIIMDFGGPNLAKAMHVGHLRSLVIGDSLSKVLQWQGYDVQTDIHWGDWGHQMGLVLASMLMQSSGEALEDFDINRLQLIYPAAAAQAKVNEEFKRQAHYLTEQLQIGTDTHILTLWNHVKEVTQDSVMDDLDTLGISFDVYNGESDSVRGIYMVRPKLVHQGNMIQPRFDAEVVRLPDMPPLIFESKQGSFLYGATDLGTLALRDEQKPDKVIYVVDQRQELHFKQVFAAAEMYGIKAQLIHAGFGTVNGTDGKPLKTRAGGVPKLREMLDEAFQAASEKNDDPVIAKAVAIAGVKFADLSNKRQTSYIYDVKKVISHEGRTGPYLLYQLVRIKHVLAKATVPLDEITIKTVGERQLALKLIAFQPTLDRVEADLAPHFLAEYLYGLAQLFSTFYTESHIADDGSRLALSELVAETLEIGLKLLGIEPVDKM